MNGKYSGTITGYLCLFLLLFVIVGGCDVDFGTSDREDDDGGGGGGTTSESVEGTIVDVIPTRENDVSNITLEITDEDTTDVFFGTTDNSGFFRVEGSFSGTPQLNFVDDDNNQNSLGRIIINVFPRARVRLGDIRLDNGNVVFEEDIRVTFDADIIENNCMGNSGSIEVEATNNNTVEILVQITNSTDLVRDGDDITCDDFMIGQEVEISGFLLVGNSVEADRIEVQ